MTPEAPARRPSPDAYEARRDAETWGGSRLQRVLRAVLYSLAGSTVVGALYGMALAGWSSKNVKGVVTLLLLLLLGPILLVSRRRKHPAALVRADEAGVAIDGKAFMSKADVVRGAYVPIKERVELHGRGGRRVAVKVAGGQEARALLRAVEEDVTQVVYEGRANAARWKAALAGIGLVVGLAGFGAASHVPTMGVKVAILAGLTALLGLAVWTLRGQRLRVGADGISLSTGGRERFIPYADVGALRTPTGMRLTVHESEIIDLDFSNKQVVREERDVLVQRIAEAKAARAHGEATHAAALLLRGGRSGQQWLRSLRSLAVGSGAGYRSAGFDRDMLLGIVEDPARAPDERAAAAVALGTSLRDEDGERLRRVAAASASPKLRIAVDAALEGDDAALVEALDTLEEEPPRAAANASRG